MIHWSRQIKQVLNVQSGNADEADETDGKNSVAGPLVELEHWKNRCADLMGITTQLDNPKIDNIIQVLKEAKSHYISQFLRLSSQIQVGENS
jgi:dynein heavy chain